MILLLTVVGVLAVLFCFVVVFGAPYVPSLRQEVREAFSELYPMTSADVVMDLGSGDGVVLLEASKKGATCYGVELNPLLVGISRLRLRGRATVRLGNMWTTQLPESVSLVYVFSVTRDATRLARYMQSEANRLDTPISLMTFGPTLKGVVPVRTHRAHSLYVFNPLQAE